MWILKPSKGLWHSYAPSGPRVALCGASVPEKSVERESKPKAFDGLLCYRCWFREELAQTAGNLTSDNEREWLTSLDFSVLTNSNRERLFAELGEDRAESLLVIHNLAVTSEFDSDEASPAISPVELAKAVVSELVAIPLALRQPTTPKEPPPSEDVSPIADTAPEAPRLKVNCSRRPSDQNGTGGISRLIRKLGRERA